MNEFEPFCDTVRKLWPDRRFTADQLHVHWLEMCSRGYEPAVVGAALIKCMRESPKAPDWSSIFAGLAASSKPRRQRDCRFRKLLEDYRGSADWERRRESDESIWAKWLREGARRITHKMQYDRNTTPWGLTFVEKPSGPCTSCSGKGSERCGLTELACRAKRWKAFEHWRWRKYLQDCDEPVPAFLADDYEKPEAVERQPSGTLF